jgi:hypothetical protein
MVRRPGSCPKPLAEMTDAEWQAECNYHEEAMHGHTPDWWAQRDADNAAGRRF